MATPLLASFPDAGLVDADRSLTFQVYSPSSTHSSTTATASASTTPKKKRKIVVGETGLIELTAASIPEGHCPVRYVVGIRKKGSSTMTICEAEAFRFNTVIKSQKEFESVQIGKKSLMARNTLGETFGTVKRKQTIRAVERNKVSANSLEGVQTLVSNTIDGSSASVPSQEEQQQELNKNRPIPPFKIDAATPGEVYNVKDILPEAYSSLLQVHHLWKCKFKNELVQELEGLNVTSWVFERIFVLLQGQKKDTQAVKRLIFLAIMIKFYTVNDYILNKESALQNAFPSIRTEILDFLLQNFTITLKDTRENNSNMNNNNLRRKITDRLRDKLLAYILCLALIIDGFHLDIGHFSADLGLTIAKATTVVKELGCKVDVRVSEAEQRKVATLVVPLKFPVRRR